MFRSTDNGSTWAEANNGLTNKMIQSIAINQRDMTFMTTESGDAYHSADDGASWTPLNMGSLRAMFSSVVADNRGTIYVTSYDKGVFRSLDHGSTWSAINSGITSLRIRTLAITQDGYLLALTQGAGVFRSKADHIEWEQSNTGLSEEPVLSLATASDGSLFAGMHGQVFHSTDNGKKWTGFCGDAARFEIYALSTNSKGRLFAGTHGEGIRAASTIRNAWERVDVRMKAPVVKAIAGNLHGIMVASTWGGDLYRSTDDGTTWLQTAFNMWFGSFGSFAVDAHGTLFATANSPAAMGCVFRSTNNGESWFQTGVVNTYIGPIVSDMKGHLFAGTSKGVIVSTNDGVEWTRYRDGAFSLGITALAIDSSSYLYAATPRNGLFRSLHATTDNRLESNETPSVFALAQNYPNPFNPTTTIEFSISKPSHTTLTVYDIIGSRVVQLVADDLIAGKHVVKWTPQSIATGTYFYRLQSGAYMDTRKLLYLK